MPSTYYIAWWNVENLFDEEELACAGPRSCSGRSAATWPAGPRHAATARSRQLASVIAQMNSGSGPDLLGVCEVENRFVLDQLVAVLNTPLPGRNYEVVHADTEDARGIDVAFIYDADLFDVPPSARCSSTS